MSSARSGPIYLLGETGDRSFLGLLDNSDQSGRDAERLVFFMPRIPVPFFSTGDFGSRESKGLSDFAPGE